MPREIRADALAMECGVPVARVLEVLAEVGNVPSRRVGQHVPERLAKLVRQRLRGAGQGLAVPAAPPADRAMFEQAMSAAGVVPLGRAEARPSRPPGPGARLPAQRIAVSPAPAAIEVPSVMVPAVGPASADPAAAENEDRLAAALVRCAALEARVAELEARQVAEQEEQRQRVLRVEDLRGDLARAEDLATRLAAGCAALPEGVPVAALLQRRGLLGVDEAWAALRALATAHLLDGALRFIATVDGARFERVLAERLALCCGGAECGAPEGVERVHVPPQRCELCGGEELTALFRHFSDACLLAGLNRVLFVGGRRWAVPWFCDRLHRRLELRAWPGDLSPRAEVVEPDLAWAQLAILRDDGRLDEDLAARVLERLPRSSVRVTAPSTAQALATAAERIEQLDPALVG